MQVDLSTLLSGYYLSTCIFLWGVIRLVAGLGLVPGYWPLRDGNVPTLMAATVEPLLTDSGRKLIPPFQLDLVNVDCGLWFAM